MDKTKKSFEVIAGSLIINKNEVESGEKWIVSEEGRKAVNTAKSQAEEAIRELEGSKQILHEALKSRLCT